MWVVGNGGLNDNCNGDGYVKSIYMMLIISVGVDGWVVYYVEVCVLVFVVIYFGNEYKILVSFVNI